LRSFALFFFGIEIITISLIPSGIVLEEKNCMMPSITSPFRRDQFIWKNLAGKPSGPGAFRGPIWNKASLISSSE
jgi:hypothetical protein